MPITGDPDTQLMLTYVRLINHNRISNKITPETVDFSIAFAEIQVKNAFNELFMH